MKKVLIGILIVSLIFTFFGCSKERTDISDYQYMYDGIVTDWNKLATPGHEHETLLGFGEYLYNSQLIFFPRETPSTLQDFYFHWTQGIDVDGYAIYFTCQLGEDHYGAFTEELANFGLQNGDNVTMPLYDDTHFSIPTYILQWSDVGEKWEVLEYIMLDKEHNTAVFVYTMSELDLIEENSAYDIAPSEMHFLTEDFSIYEDYENSTYDISFLEYLK